MTGKDVFIFIQSLVQYQNTSISKEVTTYLQKKWNLKLSEDDMEYIEMEIDKIIPEIPTEETIRSVIA